MAKKKRTFVLGVNADRFALKAEHVGDRLKVEYKSDDSSFNLDAPIDADELSDIIARAQEHLPEIFTILSMRTAKDR